jgi:hypothetical protein
LPESREALLGMLAKKNGVEFSDCMTAHFGRLAKLIPLIDEIFKVKEKHGV